MNQDLNQALELYTELVGSKGKTKASSLLIKKDNLKFPTKHLHRAASVEKLLNAVLVKNLGEDTAQLNADGKISSIDEEQLVKKAQVLLNCESIDGTVGKDTLERLLTFAKEQQKEKPKDVKVSCDEQVSDFFANLNRIMSQSQQAVPSATPIVVADRIVAPPTALPKPDKPPVDDPELKRNEQQLAIQKKRDSAFKLLRSLIGKPEEYWTDLANRQLTEHEADKAVSTLITQVSRLTAADPVNWKERDSKLFNKHAQIAEEALIERYYSIADIDPRDKVVDSDLAHKDSINMVLNKGIDQILRLTNGEYSEDGLTKKEQEYFKKVLYPASTLKKVFTLGIAK